MKVWTHLEEWPKHVRTRILWLLWRPLHLSPSRGKMTTVRSQQWSWRTVLKVNQNVRILGRVHTKVRVWHSSGHNSCLRLPRRKNQMWKQTRWKSLPIRDLHSKSQPQINRRPNIISIPGSSLLARAIKLYPAVNNYPPKARKSAVMRTVPGRPTALGPKRSARARLPQNHSGMKRYSPLFQ